MKKTDLLGFIGLPSPAALTTDHFGRLKKTIPLRLILHPSSFPFDH